MPTNGREQDDEALPGRERADGGAHELAALHDPLGERIDRHDLGRIAESHDVQTVCRLPDAARDEAAAESHERHLLKARQVDDAQAATVPATERYQRPVGRDCAHARRRPADVQADRIGGLQRCLRDPAELTASGCPLDRENAVCVRRAGDAGDNGGDEQSCQHAPHAK